MTDHPLHPLPLNIDRALDRVTKSLAGLDPPLLRHQLEVVCNAVREISHTMLEELAAELTQGMLDRLYHPPGPVCRMVVEQEEKLAEVAEYLSTYLSAPQTVSTDPGGAQVPDEG